MTRTNTPTSFAPANSGDNVSSNAIARARLYVCNIRYFGSIPPITMPSCRASTVEIYKSAPKHLRTRPVNDRVCPFWAPIFCHAAAFFIYFYMSDHLHVIGEQKKGWIKKRWSEMRLYPTWQTDRAWPNVSASRYIIFIFKMDMRGVLQSRHLR